MSPSEVKIGCWITSSGNRFELLRRAIHSIRTQRLIPGDDVLILADGPQPETEKLVLAQGPPFRYYEHPKTGDHGHSQANRALLMLEGDLLIGQDEDDIFTPRAFEVAREAAAANPDRALSFLFRDTRSRPYLPDGGLWDGHCVGFPNKKLKMASFGLDHGGDQSFVTRTREIWGEFVPTEIVIGIREPHHHMPKLAKLWDWPVETPAQVERMRQIRNACRSEMTGDRREISAEEQQAWWQAQDPANTWAYLFSEPDQEPVAYSLLRRNGRGMTVSYGVDPMHRGKGYGWPPVMHAIFAAQGPMWGEVLKGNDTILRMDQAVGWKVVGEHGTENGTVLEVETAWPPAI